MTTHAYIPHIVMEYVFIKIQFKPKCGFSSKNEMLQNANVNMKKTWNNSQRKLS
jgi:hypothetical protein